jgi:hypothetical protein
MSIHQAFRRTAVDQSMAQVLQTVTLPAPTRGIIQNENLTYMNPGGAVFCDNWVPTMRGVKLRGGCERWCVLPETNPVISGFEYIASNVQKMFAATATNLYDVTFADTPTLVQGSRTSGNYAAAQLSNQGGNWLIAVNDAGEHPLQFDGTTWTLLNAGQITGPAGSNVVNGKNLVYVWKYRERLFFIESGSMNAWYLDTNAIAGTLQMIPLSGAATKGGSLLFGATWSLDAGDGIDEKCVFCTDQGELLIFTGTNPSDASNWRQEGRYSISTPLGMNAHLAIGGDLLILTVDGIIPTTQAITKESGQLELAAITRTIKPLWRDTVNANRILPWTIKKWDEYGAIFVAAPGGKPGNQFCLAANNATGAWCRMLGWDATCFLRIRGEMYFGTQNGIIMQADQTGYDDGMPYVASLIGGWEMFQSPSSTVVWHQARASFISSVGQPFQPQLAACVDYNMYLPQPPPAGPDPGVIDVWDEGKWDQALWDQATPGLSPVRNTGWVSIGATGFSHAPVVQVTVAQQAKPDVELISIAATFERLGVNV